jgi:tetratricopeptide (TPR) repeat protein
LDIGIAHHNLGALYHDSGQLDDSVKHLGLALEMKSKAAGPRSPQMVSSLLEQAAVYRELGRLGDARASFNLAQSIAADKFDKGDRRHALLLLERGRLALASGGASDAERDLTAAVSSFRQQDDPAKLAEAMASLGDALIATAKPAEARAVLTESLALRRKVLPAGHRAILDGETRLAKIQPQPAS